MKLLAGSVLGVVLLLAVACGGGSDKASVTATAAQPSATVAGETATTQPSPTSTSLPESPTATVAPTDTPAPTATPSPTPVPPTDTPVPPTDTPVPPTATQPPAPQPTATTPPAPSGGTSATVTALNVQFSPTTVYVSAGRVTITMVNQDNQVPHNITVDGKGATETCSGPCTASVSFTATPGSYPFHCSIHPFMKGTIIVQ